jgi:hypothetical protein
MASEETPLLAKIHAKGYWRVLVRPTKYVENRIPTLSDCRRNVEESTVRLRGWDYPHIKDVTNGQNWIESAEDWLHGHIEYWRYYQTGQFVHHFAMNEDYEESSKARHGLDFINTLYRFTEIFEFAARLAARGLLSPGVTVRVELHNCEGRELFSWDPGRFIVSNHRSNTPAIEYKATTTDSQLLGHGGQRALDGTIYVLERFNWNNVPRGILAEEQAKFLERRL